MSGGVTKFLFTSTRELEQTHQWMEMYINPESISFPRKTLQNKINTKGGIVVLHWKQDLPEIDCSGKSGWILQPSILQDFTHELKSEFKGIEYKIDIKKAAQQTLAKNSQSLMQNIVNLKSSNITMNARDFVTQLQLIALEPMTYFDDSGVEKFNTKKLMIYTKRYPYGLILNGYFTSFDIDENANDAQIIPYKFHFVIEKEDDTQQTTNFLKNTFKELITTNINNLPGLGSPILKGGSIGGILGHS